MKKLHITLASILFTTTAAMSGASAASEQEIERIEVRTQVPLIGLRKIMERKEQELYNEFNKLTQVEEFKVDCKHVRKAHTGRIKQRVCSPAFVQTTVNELTQNALLRSDYSWSQGLDNLRIPKPSKIKIKKAIQAKQKAMDEHMMGLALQNPQLMAKLMDYAESRKNLTTARNQAFGRD